MKKLIIALFVMLTGFILVKPLYAASSLSLSPASGNFAAGSTMKVNVYLNTGGENINAVQANVSYPTDKLQFLSVSTGGSALTIFAEKYATGGVVRLAGGTPSPGFTGNKLIASISFKVLADTGTAALSFTGESAALRDSDNNNTLSGKSTGTYTLGKASAVPTQGASGNVSSGSKTVDSNAVKISNVVVENVTTSQAIITWKTDVKSDSTVEYGKDTTYEFNEPAKELVTDHRVVLANYVLPGTTYHFRVRSVDAAGKEGLSDDGLFMTKGYEVIVRVSDSGGAPISGAAVTLYTEPQQQIDTDSQGVARFINIAPGTHGVIVKYNKQTMIHEVEVVDGQPSTTVDLAFANATTSLPTISTPILYAIVGAIVLLVIGLTAYVVIKNRSATSNSDSPVTTL